MDDWIVIPGWEKFQHYKHRNPPWIRVYTNLLVKDEYLELSMAARGLLHGIWLLYAHQDQMLKTSDLSSIGRDTSRIEHLRWLNDAGFVQFSASSLLAKTLCNSVNTKSTASEPETDPDALLHIRELAAQVLGQRTGRL